MSHGPDQEVHSMGDTQVPVELLSEGQEFELLASEDRSRFVLRSKADHFVAHLCGEDAERFKADYDAIWLQFPLWKPDQALAQLWDQGGYSWLATQEAD
jgi:hypothetical protein